ncbi:MAG: nucleotidyltransferase family protein [Acetobacter sp.]|nr:nucleotidyltransferase family protein [Bacteroides sp.]MCM1342189.1 nucleotidyltransferase family protein [Acetobacter sp.]MCM1434386.1 nucleotidyltransferase family protein [Clostridiales bacterium]
MNNTEKFFINLLSSHLNNTMPLMQGEIDFGKLYQLAGINDVMAITANELLKVKNSNKISAEILSKFRQQIGYTLIEFDKKEAVGNKIIEIFNQNNIDYLIVKGFVLKEYYHVKEYRTSGDIDFIVRKNDLNKCKKLIFGNGFKPEDNESSDYFGSFVYDKQHIEIHTDTDYDHPYFDNIFDLCTNDGNRYYLNDYEHLLYVLCHIAKHFNMYGAGIRMFMDIDVLIRHIKDFDYDGFIEKCKAIELDTFAKACFSLCRYWFNTPVLAEFDFEKQNNIRNLFEEEIIRGGSFGFEKRGLGSYYLNLANSGGQNKTALKIKALFKLLFPNTRYLKGNFSYAYKHPILIPFAWLHRLFLAVFKRKKHSLNTISEITKNNDDQYQKLLKELHI